MKYTTWHHIEGTTYWRCMKYIKNTNNERPCDICKNVFSPDDEIWAYREKTTNRHLPISFSKGIYFCTDCISTQEEGREKGKTLLSIKLL